MNIWNLLIKEGSEDDRPKGYYASMIRNKKIVGMGSETSKNQPNAFINNISLNDYVIIRCGNDTGTMFLAKFSSEAKTGTEHGEWFDLYRSVRVLDECTDIMKEEFYNNFQKSWSDGIYPATTLQNAPNWTFANWWINTYEKKHFMSNYIQLLKNTKNLILTGAPGTGKTYLAKKIAEEIVGKEHKANIYFTQFHQSYDYTDFVEGLRPVKSKAEEIGFECIDGIFKSFCATALQNLIDSEKTAEEISLETIITNEFRLLCDDIRSGEDNKVQLKTNKQVELSNCNNSNTVLYIKPPHSEKYEYSISLNKMLQLSQKYKTKEDVEKAKPSEFEEYVPGLASYGWAVLHKLYQRISDKKLQVNATSKVERQNFVFIIDEINRGEMSKIFGELFYAIDPTCRITVDNLKNKDFEAITTQYSNMNTEPNLFDSCLDNAKQYGHFFVPENVFVIGTMNDIDRGVESIDFAFRRRFAWEEVKAKDTQSGILSSVETIEDKKISAEHLRDVMDALNDEIWSENHGIEGLSSAYHLGAAYFLKIKDYVNSSDDNTNPYNQLWDYNLKPILKEYLRGMDGADDILKNLSAVYSAKVKEFYGSN